MKLILLLSNGREKQLLLLQYLSLNKFFIALKQTRTCWLNLLIRIMILNSRHGRTSNTIHVDIDLQLLPLLPSPFRNICTLFNDRLLPFFPCGPLIFILAWRLMLIVSFWWVVPLNCSLDTSPFLIIRVAQMILLRRGRGTYIVDLILILWVVLILVRVVMPLLLLYRFLVIFLLLLRYLALIWGLNIADDEMLLPIIRLSQASDFVVVHIGKATLNRVIHCWWILIRDIFLLV